MPIVRDIPIVAARAASVFGRFVPMALLCAVLASSHYLAALADQATSQQTATADSATANQEAENQAVADGSLSPAARLPAISPDQRYPVGQEIFHCTFDGATQPDLDGWPSGWTRQRDAAHPRYVSMWVDSAAPAAGSHSLRVDLDGGAATAYSTPIPVRSIFNYVFECQVQTDGLVHDRAYFSVTFFDAQNQVLERQVSSPVTQATSWTRLRIGPLTPANEAADHAVIGLHLEPTERADLQGQAWFADVWACRLPRMMLQAGGCCHLYTESQSPELICTASGFADQNAAVEFQLLDVKGQEIHTERISLATSAVVAGAASQRFAAGATQIDLGSESAIYAGSATWKPMLPEVGFYRVRASLIDCKFVQASSSVKLALIRDQQPVTRGEFGWTLPHGEHPLTLAELGQLARQAGIQRLKLPVWDGANDSHRADQLAKFAQQLENDRIQLVGLLADPPADVRKQLAAALHWSDAAPPLAAQIFAADPAVWYPSLEPILSRLALLVHTWQLGGDDDLSFVNFPQLNKTVEQVHLQFAQYGQKSRLGISWSWQKELPQLSSGDFVTLPADSAVSSSQKTLYLERMENSPVERWVAVQPLPATAHATMDRARNLALRLLDAKLHGAQGIFLPQLCSSEYGLLNDDGSVGELFLPWRTTAQQLAGTDYLGSLQLPQGSSNQVLARDGQLVMMLWNEKPVEEQISLGEDAQKIDLWGKVIQPELDAKRQCCLSVDQQPVFLTGLNATLVQWQLSTKLAHRQWPNELGVSLENAVEITNPFSQNVSGTLRLVTSNRWRVLPRDIPFKLAVGQTLQLPFEATLPFDSASGPQEIRLDFDITADRRYQFSVYRTIDVGDDSVAIKVATRLNEQGELVVEQKLINQTEQPVSFQCSLFVPDRRRLATSVLDQGKGSDAQTYRLPNGQALLGKTLWLQAQETTGRRILNYRFVAQP